MTPLDQCWAKKPPGWRDCDPWGDASVWENRKRQLRVMAEVEEHDGERWLHLSMSHPRRMPNYEEMCYLKRHWLGEQAKAIEIHAPLAEHVNIHQTCRHLWCNLDRDTIPDMRRFCPVTGTAGI